ncbi:MAG: hypothetical protein HRT98_04385 [Mycoplasmatales bacterium]|nr:hypothetical protein [Mycoplasmatales bacterium]
MNDNQTTPGEAPVDQREYFKKFLQEWAANNLLSKTGEVKFKVMQAVKDRISRVHSYVFDTKKELITNLNEDTLKVLQKHNFKNRLTAKKLLSARTKSKYGNSAMVIRVAPGKPLVQVMELLSTPKYSNGELTEVYTTLNSISQNNEQNLLTYFHWTNNNGVVKVDTYQQDISNSQNFTPANGELIKSFTYKKINYIPIEIDVNNEEQKSDYDYAAPFLGIESDFTEKLLVEFEFVKVQLLNNRVYQPEKESEEVEQDIKNGKSRVYDVVDPDGKLQTALTYLSNGGMTTDIAMSILEKYESKVNDYTMIIAKMDGGNNKHTTEVIGANIHPLNYLWVRKNLYEEFLGRFYWKYLDILEKYGYELFTEELPEYVEVEAQLSRPMEIILQLNADSTEQDAPTEITKFQQEEITPGENNGGGE